MSMYQYVVMLIVRNICHVINAMCIIYICKYKNIYIIYIYICIHHVQKVNHQEKQWHGAHLWAHPTLQLGRAVSKPCHSRPCRSGSHLIPSRPMCWTHHDWCWISERADSEDCKYQDDDKSFIQSSFNLHIAHKGKAQKNPSKWASDSKTCAIFFTSCSAG